MSTRRGRPVCKRGQPVRFTELLDDTYVVSLAPVNPSTLLDPPAPVNPPTPVDPPAPRGPSIPSNPPPFPIPGMATPAGGAPNYGSEPLAGVVDETLSIQFFHLIQSVVRIVGAIPETHISKTMISNGVRTFSGPTSGAPNEADEWFHDTEQHIEQSSLESSRRYLGYVSMLYGNAHTWWELVATSVSTDRLTYEFFKERFQSRFIGERYMREMRHRFQYLLQGGRTASEYETEFLSRLRYGTCSVPIEKYKCRKFALGLMYELCRHVIPFQDDVFDVLVGRAKDVEEVELLASAAGCRVDRELSRRPSLPVLIRGLILCLRGVFLSLHQLYPQLLF
ncbi:hypothetical protein GQ457_01G018870 [Hibiscus cannabinus]